MAEIGKLQKTEISQEMRRAYLDYAMSVIVSRALPDVRDGLKPVHRRILFAMSEMGLSPTSKFLKSARIVGEVMGKYHPHGNMAIYDSLVRLAQDFSMRYPLINGQGNFGCFTKDTKIQLTDGRVISFESLINEHKTGKKHWTFAFNDKDNRIEVAQIKNPRLTIKDAKLIEITLDNGEKIRCTPNHRFMLRNGKYRQAQNLKSGDSLMPLYLENYEGNDNNLKGYKQVHQPTLNIWQFVHHLSDQWNLGHNVYNKASGRIRHHKDINKFNNNPDNIVRLDWKEHWLIHSQLASWRHHNDPEYVKKLDIGRKKYLEENKEKISQRTSALNKKLWKNEKYRQKHIMIIKKMWKDDNYKKMMTRLSSDHLKARWLEPVFREYIGNLKSQELKNKWQNPDYRKAMSLNMKVISQKLWEDPAHRSRISNLMKQKAADPKWRKERSKMSKALWQDETYKKKFTKDHFSKMAKILWSDSKTAKFHREKLAKQRQDPEFRKKLAAAVLKSYKKRLAQDQDLMIKLAQLSAQSLRKKWQDPEYKKNVIKSKTLRFASTLLTKYEEITPEMYERERINNGTPKLENALKYFSNFTEITSQARHYNHKVASVKLLTVKEDVYDLTIEKWHNFALAAGIFVHNSMDGDPPAADRYTEAKLQAISMEMLLDIDKETVDFIPNYDGSFKEPAFLPSLLPNLLLMGSEGIAVGMATKIPPHNLSEVIEGLSFLIDKLKVTTEPSLHVSSEVTVDELLEFIKGPDFPTAGAIYDFTEIKNVYTTGRGRILIRGKAEIEDIGQGKSAIIITELPYQVNKALLVARIADLAKEKKVDGISDLRDESDRHGIRVVVELKRDAAPKKVLNNLFKHTSLQTTFPANIVALVDGTPQTLNLKTILEEFLKHRYLVVKRRSEFELKQAKARLHILEGLKIAVENIDAVVKTIRESKTQEEAKENLMKKFKLSDIQATAILDMQLRRLAALERQKIEEEYQMVKETIVYLEDLLSHPAKILVVIKEELTKLKEKYKDERRTKVYKGKVGEFSEEDLIPNEPTVITMTDTGYIKRQSTMSFRTQQRGGKGIIGMTTKEEDNIADIKFAQTHDNLLFFTNKGKVYQIKAYEIGESSRTSKGTAIVNLLNIEAGEKVEAFVAYGKDDKSTYVLLATRNGTVKKSRISEFENIRKSGILAIKLENQDELVWSKLTSANDQVFLFTRNGKCIKFSEDQVRPMGRNTMGVRGILLGKEDQVIQMDIVQKGQKAFALTIMQNGYGKKTATDQFPKQGRGGQGVKVAEVTAKTGKIAYTQIIPASCKEVIITSQKGQIVKLDVNSIPALSRATQGVILMRFSKQGDLVASATCIEE